MVSSYLSALSASYQHSRLSEERDTLSRQLAMLQLFGCGCADSSAVLEPVKRDTPLHARSRAGGRAGGRILRMWMKSVSEYVMDAEQLLRAAAMPPVAPAAGTVQLSQLVAAKRAALAAAWDRVGQTVLVHAPRHGEGGGSAGAHIESLIAQAR